MWLKSQLCPHGGRVSEVSSGTKALGPPTSIPFPSHFWTFPKPEDEAVVSLSWNHLPTPRQPTLISFSYPALSTQVAGQARKNLQTKQKQPKCHLPRPEFQKVHYVLCVMSLFNPKSPMKGVELAPFNWIGNLGF